MEAVIKKELFNIYNKFNKDKTKVANNEMEQVKKVIEELNLGEHINYIQVQIDYEKDIFEMTDAILVKYEFELDGMNIIDYSTVNTIDHYFIRKYGKENMKIRDIRMHLDYISFEYLIRLDQTIVED